MDHEHTHHAQPLETPREYVKFAGVITLIVVASVLLAARRGWGAAQFMGDFMGIFLLTFGAFKLVNLQMFALTYRSYDLVTQRVPAWGYLFPFVELGLGLAYLLSASFWLNIATLVITGVAGIGVLRELTKKSKIMCACLGTVIRLPLSKVSFVEDFLMFGMAALMLWL